MSIRYGYVVEQSVLQAFLGLNKREREQLLRMLSDLADSPSQKGDYRQKSASGREIEVKRCGRWLISFWPDHPVCELRVVDIVRVVP
jgi:hypothetical protein